MGGFNFFLLKYIQPLTISFLLSCNQTLPFAAIRTRESNGIIQVIPLFSFSFHALTCDSPFSLVFVFVFLTTCFILITLFDLEFDVAILIMYQNIFIRLRSSKFVVACVVVKVDITLVSSGVDE